MAGSSLNKKLYDHFKFYTQIPTTSTFLQARAGILPEAFHFYSTNSTNNVKICDTRVIN